MIIESLLDTDLYKFTMMQVVLHHFPSADVEYRFRCRTEGVDLAVLAERVSVEVDHLCTLSFADDEIAYLRSLRFISSDFADFLGLFRLNRKWISIEAREHGALEIIIRGPWLHTILFEIPVLAIVNELHFERVLPEPDFAVARARLEAKLALVNAPADVGNGNIADYGTRRRFSRAWQEEVLLTTRRLLGPRFAGTSNVLFAWRFGIIPLGTMAHEYLQACQSLGPRLRDSQIYAFEMWAREYRGDLGIALSDVYGMTAFLRDFDLYFCKLFDGARHDSGDPFEWGERLIAHYERHRVDPKTKLLVFSDSLTFPLIVELGRRFAGRVKLAFGIGTNLTNDVGGTPLSIVIKMVRCNGQPVAKLSDSPAKNMCDDVAYVTYLRQVFEIPAPVDTVA